MSIRGLERPLDLGEIVDRAVTLSVRQFPKLLALVAIVALPLAILQSFGVNPLNSYISAIQAGAKGSPADIGKILAAGPTARPFDYLVLLIALLIGPLISGAMTIAIARSLAGDKLTIASSYAPALRRWPSMLAGLVLWMLVAVAGMLVIGLAIGAAAFLIVRKTGGVPSIATVIPLVAIFGVGMLVSVPVFAVMYVLAILTSTGIMLETKNPFVAFGRSFARVFARREFLRAMVVAFAIVASTLVVSLHGALVGGVAFALTKWYPVYIILAQLFNAVSSIFATAVFTVYYFDVRLRREGSDLLAVPTAERALA